MVRTLFGMSVGLNSIQFGVVLIEIIFSLIQTSFGMYNSLLPPIRTFELQVPFRGTRSFTPWSLQFKAPSKVREISLFVCQIKSVRKYFQF